MTDFMFLALSFLAIAGGAAMLINRHPMYAALGLLISILAVAGLFALLSATFLFMVQVIVYAGAIMTLILFILMFLNINEEDLPDEPNKFKFIALGVVLMLPINILVIKAISQLPKADFSILGSDFGGIKEVGLLLYQNWLVSFELISILLLVALLGAVILVKKRKARNNV